jgi:nucleotide-binding universal stress UspA family protein
VEATDAPAANKKLRVLWATDGSENARSAATMLRRMVLPAAESLTVLSIAPHSFLSGARPDPVFLTKIRPAAKRRALEESEQVARDEATLLDPPAIAVEAIARWGNPIEEILKAARTRQSDLIVMGAKGHSNLGLLLLGSVASGVVQNSTRSVLITRPDAGEPRRLLVGYDGSPHARRGLQFLDQIALPAAAEIILTQVLEPFAVPAGTPVTYRKRAMEEAQAINEGRHRAAERTLEQAAAQLSTSGRKILTRIVEGAASLALAEAAKEAHADLIVVGSRKPSPARHYLLGSTAEKLVRNASQSVLVVR